LKNENCKVKNEKYWNKIAIIAKFALYIFQFALSLAFFQRAKLLQKINPIPLSRNGV